MFQLLTEDVNKRTFLNFCSKWGHLHAQPNDQSPVARSTAPTPTSFLQIGLLLAKHCFFSCQNSFLAEDTLAPTLAPLQDGVYVCVFPKCGFSCCSSNAMSGTRNHTGVVDARAGTSCSPEHCILNVLVRKCPTILPPKAVKQRQFWEKTGKHPTTPETWLRDGVVEFCKGARQSGLVSVWQHTLVGQQWQGFL